MHTNTDKRKHKKTYIKNINKTISDLILIILSIVYIDDHVILSPYFSHNIARVSDTPIVTIIYLSVRQLGSISFLTMALEVAFMERLF